MMPQNLTQEQADMIAAAIEPAAIAAIRRHAAAKLDRIAHRLEVVLDEALHRRLHRDWCLD